MSFVGDLFSSGSGARFQANNAPLVTQDAGMLQGEYNQTYDQSYDALKRQQDFVNALQAQGGLQNQANVFGQQQALANQLQGVANGTGPNPALAQLNQTTNANIANQAALMAGQRGAGANAGLLARQAAQQGGALQQQAVGQGATLQAQQQLAAMQALGQQQAQLQGTATNQVAQQAQGLGALNSAAQGLYGGVNQAIAGQNSANIQNQSQMNSANGAIAQGNQKAQSGLIGGLLGGAGSALQPSITKAVSSIFAHGGKVPEGSAPVAGDSPKNDTVPAMLSPNEIVIPRSITMGPNAPQEAAKFVAQELAKHHTKMAKFYSGGGVSMDDTEDATASSTESPMPADATSPSNVAPVEAPRAPAGVSASWDTDPVAQAPMAGQAMPSKEGGGTMPMEQPQGPYDNSIKALQSQQGAYGQEAKALGQLGKEQAAISSSAQQEIAAKEKDFMAHQAEFDTKKAMLADEIKNGKVSPDRLMANTSTGQKVASAIGLILGGMGAGLTGGENPALKFLNQQIDNDVKAQQSDLDNKHTLYSYYLRQGNDAREAFNLSKASSLEMAKMKMDESALKFQGTIAGARAQQASGQLGQQIAALRDQTARSNLVKQELAKTNDPIRKIELLYPPGTKGREELLKEAGQAQVYAKERDNVIHAFNQVQDAYKPGNVLSPAENATKKRQLFASLAQLQKSVSGRFNLEELKGLEEQFKPNYTGDDKIKLQNLLKTLDSKVSFPHAEAAGINLSSSYGRTTPTGESKIKLGPAVR